MESVILILLAYLLGSVLFGDLIARMKGIDIRSVGSGNVGATNVGRALGKRYALVVFLLDMLKGFIPFYVGFRIYQIEGIGLVALGVAPVLGHMFPVFARFRGGKGVATAFGVLLALSPQVALVALLIWSVVLLISRYVSLASITAASLTPVILALSGHAVPVISMGVITAVLIVLKHRPNIERLLRGEEHRV